MKAAGYMNLNITMQGEKTEDIIEHIQKFPEKFEQRLCYELETND
ncbi:hypothetical protein [Bacillus inaquosorum]|nr:hypothetical protein [Bacillus inaquosorum]